MSESTSQIEGIEDKILSERLGRGTGTKEKNIIDYTFPGHASRRIDLSLGPLPMSWNEQVLVAVAQLLSPTIMVEIGVLFGQTTAALAMVLAPGGTIYGLDIDMSRARDYINLWPELWDRIVLLEGNSHSTLGTVPDNINFAYIDGDHGDAHVTREIEILWPKLAPNAIVAFHDANDIKGAMNTLPNRIVFRAGAGLVLVQKQ